MENSDTGSRLFLFSQERLEISLEAGKTVRGELYLGTEENEKIQGYVTSSSRRFVPGSSRFSGTTVCIPYGVDGTGMKPGDQCSGWLCITSSAGEYKIPFEIHAEKDSFRNTQKEIKNYGSLPGNRKKMISGRHIAFFNDKCFPEMMEKGRQQTKMLFMQGFLISLSPIRIWKNFLWA